MSYTVESLKEIVNNSKKSFLYFGEYIEQNRVLLGEKECSIGENLMKILLSNIHVYEDIIKKSVEEGKVDEAYFDFLTTSQQYLDIVNTKIHSEYSDIFTKK